MTKALMTAASLGVLAFTAWWMLTLTQSLDGGPLASPFAGVALLVASTALALLALRAQRADRAATPDKAQTARSPVPASLAKAHVPMFEADARLRHLAMDALPPPTPVKDSLFEDSGIISVDSATTALDHGQGVASTRLMAFMEALPGATPIDMGAAMDEILDLGPAIEGSPPESCDLISALVGNKERASDSVEPGFVIFDPELNGENLLHAEGDLEALWEGVEPFPR